MVSSVGSVLSVNTVFAVLAVKVVNGFLWCVAVLTILAVSTVFAVNADWFTYRSDGIVYRNGVERVSKEFPWICVPLVIEADASAVDGSWAKMTEVGALGPDGIADRDWRNKFEP